MLYLKHVIWAVGLLPSPAMLRVLLDLPFPTRVNVVTRLYKFLRRLNSRDERAECIVLRHDSHAQTHIESAIFGR